MADALVTTGTTIEKQLFEIAGKMQELETTAAAANSEFTSLLTLALDAEGGTMTLTATLPATIASTAGVLSFTPDEYLP